MSIFEREPFADFLHQVIRLRKAAERTHPIHDALLQGRANDEETVAALATSPSDAVRTRKALRTIHSDFPYGAAVPEQSAYLVRAFIGLDPFGDDDRDTVWAYLLELLAAHGWTVQADAREQGALTNHLRDRLEVLHPSGFARRHVLDRDDVFSDLVDWFDARLSTSA